MFATGLTATVFSLLTLAVPNASANTPELELVSVLSTAVSGIPVVIELAYKNPSDAPLTVIALHDPYMDFTSWQWRSGDGGYKVQLKDLHFAAIPRPAPPRMITLDPGDRRAWHCAVPTPPTFGDRVKWTLTVTVKNLQKRGESQSASTGLVGNDPPIRLVADALGSTWAQAPILELFETRAAHMQLTRLNKHGTIEECSRKGDRAADLILFSRAIFNKQAIAQHWQGLENASDEIKCLRNYLLFYPLQHTRGILTEEEAEAVISSVPPKSALGPELIERIKNRRRF